MRRIVSIFVAVICLVVVSQAGATLYPSLPTVGQRILPVAATQTFSASQDTYWRAGDIESIYTACQGFPAFLSWPVSAQLRFFDPNIWRAELWVGPVGGPLSRVSTNHGVFYVTPDDPLAACGTPSIVEFDWQNFPAGTFAPGTYTFDSRWYGDPNHDATSTLTFERVSTVTVMP